MVPGGASAHVASKRAKCDPRHQGRVCPVSLTWVTYISDKEDEQLLSALDI